MATYNIVNAIPNINSGNKTIIIAPDAGYLLPSSVSVSGGTLISYDSSTGVVVISGDDVIVSATCAEILPYLTFSSPDTFTLNIVDNQKYWDGTLQYSTDTTTWNTWDGTTTLSSSSDDTTKYLYLRGVGNTYITGSSASNTKCKWVLTGNNINCDGNIETLLDYATVINGQHPPMATYCYCSLFRGCTSLTTAPSLSATTLATYCYQIMFSGCTSLATAPSLPATTLAQNCYYLMFSGCTSLATAPSLPATTLANSCYRNMFSSCSSLATAPSLPATTLANSCYESMFSNCASLTTAPSLPATTLANYCYRYMFQNCTSLTAAPFLFATTLTNYCYCSMFQGCTSLTTAPSLPATTLTENCYDSMFNRCTSLTTPATIGNGTTQLTAAKYCCNAMYNFCTSLNLFTSSTDHIPFYKALTYSSSSSSTSFYSTYRMFYYCKIDGTTSTTNYITAGTQFYY